MFYPSFKTFKKIGAFLLAFGFVLNPVLVLAQSDLQRSINEKNDEIEELQKEINQYQAQANQVAGQAQTLQSVLNQINAEEAKLNKNITLTNKKIERTGLTIKQNEKKIADLGQGIVSNTSALNETIRALNHNDQLSLLELLATQESMSDFLRDVDDVITVQEAVKTHVVQLTDTKTSLEKTQVALAKDKKNLEVLSTQLVDQKKIIVVQQREKADLLAQTKNQEAAYQALVAERQARVNQLTAEIFAYESQLKFTLDANSLPKPGSAPLSWPLDMVFVTQRFGKTSASGRLYASGTHSGVDFRAATGTPVYATADGTVEGTGDTDTVCYRASFGKWVFIRHTNGLSTVSAHLSLIKASEGQKVKRGDLIGYSGNTGHSTAPHLHLTVFASNGVNGEQGARVDTKPSISCGGKVYKMPIAPTSAYLDPLLYLPRAAATQFKDGAGSTNE